MTTKLESEAPRVQVDLRAQFRNISNNSNDSNGNRGSLRISKRCSRRFSIQDDTETNFGISIDSVDSNEGSGLLSDGGGGDTTNFNYSDEYPYFGGPYAHIRKTLDHEYHTTYTKERQWLQDSIIDKLLNEIVVPNNNHKSNSQSISSSSSSSSSSCPPLPCDNGDNHTNNKNSNNNGLGKKRPSDTSLDKLSWMPEEPWLVYLVGTCHAPKSTALRLLLNEDDDDEDEDEDDYSNNGKSGDTKVDRPPRFPILSFVLVDPMEIQSLLPEYESYAAQSQSQSQSQHQNQNQNQNQTNKNTNIDNTEPDSVELISMRKETGYIAEILTRTALHLGTNVVVYTTFWNADWYPRYFELLRGEFCQRKLRIAILHLLAYDERTLYADAAYDALENDDDGGSVDGDHNCDGATSASTGTKTKRAITTTAAAPCMSSTSSTPLLSTIREGSSAALKILRSFSTSTIKTADSSTYGGSIGNSSSFISSSSSGGSSDSSACSMSQNSNKDMINNNITQNESSRIFTAVKALIPHVEYNCLLKATEQNNDVNIETKGITWKSFYTQFKQTSAVTGTVVLDNHGEERCCHLTKTNSVQHRGTNVLIQTFDVNQSTEENHKTDAMEFFGPYAHIRKTLDYKYHKNYRKDRQMLQDAIITDTLDAPRVIDSSGQVCTTPTEPFLVFTAGNAMGAGKSHTLNFLNERGNFPLAAFVLIDPDEIRQNLPEFSLYVSKDPLHAGSMTRKEAGYIVEILTLAALQSGKNVLVDTSLRDHEWYKEYFAMIRKDYPNVKLAILHVVAPEEAVFKRAETRAKITGRVVPKETLEMALRQVPKSVKILKSRVDYYCALNNAPGKDISILTKNITWEDFKSVWVQTCAWIPKQTNKKKLSNK